MNLAEKINLLMTQNDIKNPKELSEKLNEKGLKIPYTTLLTIINNEVQDIKLGTAKKICTFFRITLDELLDDNIPILDITKPLNTDGLSEQDIKELQELIEIKKKLRKNEGNN